jgi:hypothetical protein
MWRATTPCAATSARQPSFMRPEDRPTRLRTLCGVCGRLTSSLQSSEHIPGAQAFGSAVRNGYEGGARLERSYAALERVPLFRNVRQEDIELELLGGALTNICYKVTTGGGAYVLRLAGEGTSDYIDRSAEEHNKRVSAAAGVNADVVYFDARDGTMVSRFVEGVCMNAGDRFGRDSGATSLPSTRALRLRTGRRRRNSRKRFAEGGRLWIGSSGGWKGCCAPAWA